MLFALPAERKDVRAGNRAYKKGDYATAEIDYRRALDKVGESVGAKFNLANALYKQIDSLDAAQNDGVKQQLEQSRKLYETVAETASSDEQKAAAYYNEGNTYLREQNFKTAVESYKKSLRLNPKDMEAKQNLVFAQAMSNQQQQQPQQQQQQQDKDKDKKDDEKKEQDKNQQDQQQQQQPQQQDNNQDKQQQQQQQEKISKEDAQRMLEALEQQEKETQDKVKKEKAQKARQRSSDKNW
jgi:tetratricopeptide (TPR) repeat protein